MTSKVTSTSDSSSSSDSTTTHDTSANFLYHAVKGAVAVYALYHCCATAYAIRMQSIEEFGPVIHEFDPYFNFRATEVRWSHALVLTVVHSLSLFMARKFSPTEICGNLPSYC